MKKHVEWNKKENTRYQNLRSAPSVVMREKFAALNVCIIKEESFQINHQCNIDQKKAGVAILISNKPFRAKKREIKRDITHDKRSIH